MNKQFIELHAVDLFLEDDDAFNPIYVRPNNIVHIEVYNGAFPLQAYGPDGKLVLTGKHRQLFGAGMIVLYAGGTRIVKESPSQILSILEEATNEL